MPPPNTPLAERQRGQRRRRFPVIISALVVISLCILAVRHNSPSMRVDHATLHPSLPGHSPSSSASSEPRDEAVQHNPGACFAKFPWIEPALEQFFAPARASAAASTQTSAESLDKMDTIEWVDGYHPGKKILLHKISMMSNPALSRMAH